MFHYLFSNCIVNLRRQRFQPWNEFFNRSSFGSRSCCPPVTRKSISHHQSISHSPFCQSPSVNPVTLSRISSQDRTSNNLFKLEKLKLGKKWFSNRVVDEWNGPSKHIISAESMGRFKRRLDKFMDEDDRWN